MNNLFSNLVTISCKLTLLVYKLLSNINAKNLQNDFCKFITLQQDAELEFTSVILLNLSF